MGKTINRDTQRQLLPPIMRMQRDYYCLQCYAGQWIFGLRGKDVHSELCFIAVKLSMSKIAVKIMMRIVI